MQMLCLCYGKGVRPSVRPSHAWCSCDHTNKKVQLSLLKTVRFLLPYWPSESSKVNNYHLMWQGVCHFLLHINRNLRLLLICDKKWHTHFQTWWKLSTLDDLKVNTATVTVHAVARLTWRLRGYLRSKVPITDVFIMIMIVDIADGWMSAVSLQSAAAAAAASSSCVSAAVTDQSLVDRLLMQTTCGNHDNDKLSPTASHHQSAFQLCSAFGFTQEQASVIHLRDSRKSRKHGNRGNSNFRQMPWFCVSTRFFWILVSIS